MCVRHTCVCEFVNAFSEFAISSAVFLHSYSHFYIKIFFIVFCYATHTYACILLRTHSFYFFLPIVQCLSSVKHSVQIFCLVYSNFWSIGKMWKSKLFTFAVMPMCCQRIHRMRIGFQLHMFSAKNYSKVVHFKAAE